MKISCPKMINPAIYCGVRSIMPWALAQHNNLIVVIGCQSILPFALIIFLTGGNPDDENN